MRSLVGCLALLVVCGPVAAQPAVDGLSVMAYLLGGDDDTIDDGAPFCPPQGTTEWALVCGAVACGGAIAFLVDDYVNDSCATPAGRTRGVAPEASGVPVQAENGVRVVEHSEATHIVYGVRRARRGVGLVPSTAGVTVRVVDAETGQPLALGPLGAPTAVVRHAEELQALLEDDLRLRPRHETGVEKGLIHKP